MDDSDGDGIISRADFGAAMCKHDTSWLNESKATQLDQMYAAVDLDGTGAVTFDKFAVMRVRNALAYATHTFFQTAGFMYVHAPLITGADCEGAGEMFQVTTMDVGNAPKTGGAVDYTQACASLSLSPSLSPLSLLSLILPDTLIP